MLFEFTLQWCYKLFAWKKKQKIVNFKDHDKIPGFDFCL